MFFPLDFQGSLNHPKGNHAKQAAFYMTFSLVNFAVKNATVFFPFLLSRTGLTISVSLLPISDALHCNRPCSAVQPLLQCTASVLAVHCILHTHATFPASTCNHPCTYLRPPLQYLREKTPLYRISSSSPYNLSPLSSGILPCRQQRVARGYHMS